MTIPAVTRLDNAALIYPPICTRKYTPLFRMSATMSETVSMEDLNSALARVIVRFPSFGYTLDHGFFWWYLRKIDTAPRVSVSSGLGPFDFKQNGGYMFRVSSIADRIDLDVFHVVTDGMGAMTFLMSLVAEYLRIHNGAELAYGGFVLDPSDEPSEDEFNDGFRAFSGLKGSLDKDTRAYHLKGEVEPFDVLHSVSLRMDTAILQTKASEFGCTVTTFLTSLMLNAIQKIHKGDPSRTKSDSIRVEVPVNLRNMFGCRTMRNFSSYVYVGLDLKNTSYSLEQIIPEVSLQKELLTQRHRITHKVAANVALEDNPAIAMIPRFVKKPIMNLINYLKGDSYCTQTLSNLGNINLPEGMREYVKGVEFTLGRTRIKSGAAACVSYGGRTVLTFTRRIREDAFEMAFAKELEACGIDYSMYIQ